MIETGKICNSLYLMEKVKTGIVPNKYRYLYKQFDSYTVSYFIIEKKQDEVKI